MCVMRVCSRTRLYERQSLSQFHMGYVCAVCACVRVHSRTRLSEGKSLSISISHVVYVCVCGEYVRARVMVFTRACGCACEYSRARLLESRTLKVFASNVPAVECKCVYMFTPVVVCGSIVPRVRVRVRASEHACARCSLVDVYVYMPFNVGNGCALCACGVLRVCARWGQVGLYVLTSVDASRGTVRCARMMCGLIV
jgi:hypothetical protein